jgi:nitrite reductase/ring-hydroxylating ferredoxin subunit
MSAVRSLAAPAGSRLCRVDDIEDGDCLEVRCRPEPAPSIIVMRSENQAWAYVNLCPHFSLPLNSRPNEFLVDGKERVMCAFHCAVFRFRDGTCVEGPAVGMGLEAVPVTIENGEVVVA